MRYRTMLTTAPTVALGILAIVTGPVLGQASGPGDDPPVVLHLADADPPGLQSEAEATFFAQRVHDLSGGDMTIEVIQAAAVDVDQPLGPEVAVAQMVQAGDYELGLTTSRPWDLIGVTSMQALQTPFLIDDTALAVAVAQSDIATQALDGLSSAGLTGLALWPEHLRYLFAYPPQGKAFLAPEDVAGSILNAAFSASGRRYLTDLGAAIWAGEDLDGDVATGALQGGEFGFFNGPSNAGSTFATGNLVFYPRTKMLFANGPALASLTDRQRGSWGRRSRRPVRTRSPMWPTSPPRRSATAGWMDMSPSLQVTPSRRSTPRRSPPSMPCVPIRSRRSSSMTSPRSRRL